MLNNRITQVRQEEISVLETIHLDQEILIRIQKLTRYEICPNCTYPANRIHQIIQEKSKNPPLQNKKTPRIFKRRF